MKIVGYLEGTDSLLLTKLASQGIGVLPLGNGADNHGKYIGLITKADNIGIVVGYVHKVLPVPGRTLGPKDILFSCTTNKIPVIIIASKEDIKDANKQLGDVKESVTVVSPEKLYDTIMQNLK